jgi:solute carrier family 36 (proton-coupled amino acid transporter)
MQVILGIICFYSFFGVFCWLSFGDEVATAMTTSLPETNLATSVQLAYSIAVVFTFPLQNYPSLEITIRTIQTCFRRVSLPGLSLILGSRNLIASVLVCLLALVASVTLDRLDKVVSLMGSLLGIPLAFIFPALIHNRLDPDLSPRRRVQNVIVAALGFIAMILASVTTILAW